MKSATDDITEKGTAPIKGIRPSNPNYKPIDRKAFREANPDFYAKRRASSAVHDYYIHRAKTGSEGNEIFGADTFYNPQYMGEEVLDATRFGDSTYDPGVLSAGLLPKLQDIRAYEQPWYAQIGAGIGKGIVNVATTASGLAGTLWGVAQGAISLLDDDPKTGFWRSLWDNPINQFLNAVNQGAEEVMPNYYSLYEQETPFILNANFIGDKIIKNLGFMVGAFYGGMPVSSFVGKSMNAVTRSMWNAARANRLAQIGRGVKAADVADNFRKGLQAVYRMRAASKYITSFTGSLTSAMNEGAIEAVSNTTDFVEVKATQYTMEHNQKIDQIKQQYANNPSGLQQALQSENLQFKNRMDALEEERIRMGNADFALNIGILTMNNMNMFSKLYRRGFQHSLREFNVFGSIQEGYRAGSTWLKGLAKGVKNSISEGMEEYLQRAASDGPKNKAIESLNNYIDATKDYKSNYSAWENIGSFAKATIQNASDPRAWEEFSIGAVSAMLGMPVFGANTRNAWTGNNGKFGLSGGIIGEIIDANRDRAREQGLVEYMNIRVKDPKFRALYEGMVAHHKFDEVKKEALKRGDKKAFEDAEWDQFFKDVTTWAKAGKLGQFKELLDFNSDYSDEELESAVALSKKIKSAQQQKEEDTKQLDTLKKQRERLQAKRDSAEKAEDEAWDAGKDIMRRAARDNRRQLGDDIRQIDNQIQELTDRIQQDSYTDIVSGDFYEGGEPLTTTEERKARMREILRDNNEKLQRQINEILQTVNEVDMETQGLLNEDQLSALAYLKSKIYNADERAIEAEQNFKEKLEPIIKQRRLLEEGLQDEINQIESKSSEEKRTEEENKELKAKKDRLKAIQDNNNMLEKILHADTETIQGYLLNPLTRTKVLSILNDLNSVSQHEDNGSVSQSQSTDGQYSALDIQKTISDAYELVALAMDKLQYRKLFEEYLRDPSKLQDDINASEERTTENALNQQATNVFEKLRNVKTFKDFSKILLSPDMNSDLINKVLEKVKESGSEELQNIADQFKNVHKAYDSLVEIAMNDKTVTPEMQSEILDLIDEEMDGVLEDDINENKSEAFQERLAQLVKDLAKTNPQLSKKLDAILNHYKRQKQANAEPSDDGGKKKKRGEKKKKKKEPKKDDEPVEVTKESIQELLEDYWNEYYYTDAFDDIIKAVGTDNLITPEIQKAIDEWNSKHPDDLISDSWVAELLQKYLDDLGLDEDDGIDANKKKDTDMSTEEDQQSSRAAEMSANMNTSFHSSRVTRYKIMNEDGTYASAKQLYEPADTIDKRVQEILEERGAYEFVDRGYLGTIFQEDPDIDVYYLKSHESGVSQGATFLAIEWTNELASLIKKKHFNGKGSVDLSQYIKPVTLTFNGEKRQFVLIGSMGVTAGADAAVAQSYANQESLLNAEYQKNDEDFFISEKYQNKIDTINTGRLDKQTLEVADDGTITRDVYTPIEDWVSQSTEWDNGRGDQFHLRVVVGNDVEGENTGSGLDNIVKPNSTWLNSHSGAVLMFVKRPDGMLYPVRCVRKTVQQYLGEHLADFESIVDAVLANRVTAHSSYLEQIAKHLKALVDPDSTFGQKVKAKMELRNFFVLGQMSNINIENFGDSYGVQIFGESLEETDIKANIMKALEIMAKNDVIFTVPMQSKRSGISDNAIISAGVLQVSLNGFYNFNANFSIRPTDSEGKPLDKTTQPVEGGPDNNTPQQEVYSTNSASYVVTFSKDDGSVTGITRQDGQEIGEHEYKSVVFFINASRGQAKSMAEELSLPSEYSYFQKVYYNQELGIMYDANKTGNSRQLTTEEAIKEVLDKKKKLDRDRVKKAEIAAAAALAKLRELAGMTQEQLGDYFVEHGLPEGVSAYDALTARPKLRGQTQAQRADYYNTQKEIAQAYKELMESLTEAWFNSTGIPNVIAHQGGTWNHFTVNNGTTEGATETHKAYITLTLDALQDLSQEKIAEILDALQKSGFNGQIKFASIGSRALLAFDNIVMHGATEEDAKKALETVTKVLGKESVEYSQFGVDKNGTSHTNDLASSIEERIKNKKNGPVETPTITQETEQGEMFVASWTSDGTHNNADMKSFPWQKRATRDPRKTGRTIAPNKGDRAWGKDEDGRDGYWMETGGRNDYTSVIFNFPVPEDLKPLIEKFIAENQKSRFDFEGLAQVIRDYFDKKPKGPTGGIGQQSHWFDNVELDDEGRVNVDALPDNDPIVTQILSHTSLGLRTKPVRKLLDGLMMAEQTGKINLNDASAIQEIADILEKSSTPKELTQALDVYLHEKLCLL